MVQQPVSEIHEDLAHGLQLVNGSYQLFVTIINIPAGRMLVLCSSSKDDGKIKCPLLALRGGFGGWWDKNLVLSTCVQTNVALSLVLMARGSIRCPPGALRV